jgi:type IV secretory pathway VirB3-like protein
MIIIVVVIVHEFVIIVVVVVMHIQVNLGQTCLQEPNNMRQKIIYK